MAYYNANEVIKLTRKAMGITQEKLCEGICDISTLSKIENGHYGVRQATYRKLMEKMGRGTEMRYPVCLKQNGELLEDRTAWERANKRYDYGEAERYLRKMQAEADDNVLTRQYLARAEALLDFYQKRSSAEELAERIDGAIRMTVPDYERFLNSEKVFPFFKEELLALVSLGNAYLMTGEKERGRRMYETVIGYLNANYMGDPDKTQMRITVKNNIARANAEEGNHVEALREIDTCLRLCRERDYSHLVGPLLASKAHNYVRLVEKGYWGKERLEEAEMLLRQAYVIAAARRESESMARVVKYCERHFKKEADS